MSEYIVSEYQEDGIVKAVLTHPDETIDGYINFIKLEFQNVKDENALVAIVLKNMPRGEAIELLSCMMKMNQEEVWEFVIKAIPVLLVECESYRIEFTGGVLWYNEFDEKSQDVRVSSSGAISVVEHYVEQGCYLVMNTGIFEGRKINFTKYLRKPIGVEELMNPQQQVLEFEDCIKNYKNLFRYMKNGGVDALLLKARMLGSNDITIE